MSINFKKSALTAISLLFSIKSALLPANDLPPWLIDASTNGIYTTDYACIDKDRSAVEAIAEAAVQLSFNLSFENSAITDTMDPNTIIKRVTAEEIGQYIDVKSMTKPKGDSGGFEMASKVTFSDGKKSSLMKMYSIHGSNAEVIDSVSEYEIKQLSEEQIISLLLADPAVKFYVQNITINEATLKCSVMKLALDRTEDYGIDPQTESILYQEFRAHQKAEKEKAEKELEKDPE